jgi:hypothetical protein
MQHLFFRDEFAINSVVSHNKNETHIFCEAVFFFISETNFAIGFGYI